MSVKVLFFASLRERLGRNQVTLEVASPLDIPTVWQRSSGEPGLPDGIQVAVNQCYVQPGTLVQPGDEVAFFPPVTGG